MKKVRKIPVFIVLLLIVNFTVTALPTTASACSCVKPPSVNKVLNEHGTVIFSGK